MFEDVRPEETATDKSTNSKLRKKRKKKENASEKQSRGRPRLPQDIRQLRLKESRKKFAKKQSSIKLTNTVKKKLLTLKKQNKLKS